MSQRIFYPQLQKWPSSWVHMVGADARDFLQRVTTVNAKILEVGKGKKGFFLQANGKILAAFDVWNTAENEFGFEVFGPEEWKKALCSTIDQLTFAEKIEVHDVAVLENVWILTDEDADGFGTTEGDTLAAPGGVRICNHGRKDFGKLWLSLWGLKEALGPWVADQFPNATEALDIDLDEMRIRNLRPRAGLEMTFETTPLEIGLKDGVAENKGCYPGQEVIERIISLGSPARRLCLVEVKEDRDLPQPLMNDAEPAQEVGIVTSLLGPNSQGLRLGLALIKKIHAKEGLRLKEGQVIRVSQG
ncbi:MAG: hypothetical protein JNL01_06910 [Bdellovibrionales bacterium]|nr:hypothetical protein [Bdellovibrionales bacterium]